VLVGQLPDSGDDVSGWNFRNEQPGDGENDGGGASAVDARTPATLASK